MGFWKYQRDKGSIILWLIAGMIFGGIPAFVFTKIIGIGLDDSFSITMTVSVIAAVLIWLKFGGPSQEDK